MFRVNPGANAELANLTIADGLVPPGSGAEGGAGIANSGTLAITKSTIRDNLMVGSPGGGIYNAGTLVVSNCALLNNDVSDSFGGGIYNAGALVVSNCTLRDNFGGDAGGGGIYNSGTATLGNSTLTGNIVGDDGGGAITNAGTLDISNTTLSENASTGSGGAIYNFGSLKVSNSTLSDNDASTDGGGIFNFGPLIVYNSTFSHNRARLVGGLFNGFGDPVIVAHTILANSPAGGDCFNDSGSTILAAGVSLVEDGSCGFSVAGDPLLGPLQDNGGATATHALIAGSPAIDAGDNVLCAADPVNNLDQRGVTRPQGIFCDIGAFELEQPPTAIDLIFFQASASESTVILRWETASEIDSGGFHLHRARAEADAYERISDRIIPARGALEAGAVYTYADQPGQGSFFYRLQEVDTQGRSTYHGPVAAQVAAQGSSSEGFISRPLAGRQAPGAGGQAWLRGPRAAERGRDAWRRGRPC